MKTNQNMIRKMGNFDVTQRTKDGMFNATSLIKQFNKGKRGKEVNGFLKTKPTQEFINALLNAENLNTNQIVLTTRGKNGGTWMHPYLFIDFAMWLNPTFKLQVIKFVYDEMIKYRNEAGNAYKKLAKSVGKIVQSDSMAQTMQHISKAMNFIVFNKHEKGIRNNFGIEEKQKELFDLEIRISNTINDGFIKNMNDLKIYLKKLYRMKYLPEVFN